MIRLPSLLILGTWLLCNTAAPLSAQTPATVAADGHAVSARVSLPQPGEIAPAFTVVGPKGETIRLADFLGRVVIVDVSATWCGPCQAAMPNNDRIYRKYADQGVVLLGVTTDDARAAYDGWLQRNAGKYHFTMAFDPAGRDGWKDSVFNTQYHISGFPTMFVIGRDGKVVESVSGGGPGEDYRLEYALARAGIKVDLAAIPPEPKRDPNAPKSIPAVAKTPAKSAGMSMGGGGGGGGKRELVPTKFGSVSAGELVPDFTVTGADGAAVKLSSFRGKPLLVHFVTSRGPQDWFEDIVKTYADQGLTELVVFAAAERAEFDAWLAQHPTRPYAVAWDPAGKAWAEGVTNTAFGVGMFPATVVIAADGKLVSGTIGMGEKVATTVKFMLLAARAIKPTEADLAKMRAAAQALMAGGGMKPATAQAGPPKPATLAAGAVAPDFAMQDVTGRTVRLSDFKDKVVILDFWATWCGPCVSSFPHTQRIAAQYKDQGVVVLASGTSDTIAKFKEWIPKNQPKYPDLQFYFDPNERGAATFDDRASSKLYHVVGIPSQFVIGRDGRIVATIVGNGGDSDARTEGALAAAGVKVDEAVAAKGREQLAQDAVKAKARADEATAEEKNPRPPFRENFGKLKAGETVPDFDLLRPDGTPVKFSALAPGRVTVLGIWSGGSGPGEGLAKDWAAWGAKYPDVAFIGLGGYANLDQVAKWQADNAGKFAFTLVADPAGKPISSAKPMDELTDEERAILSKAQSEQFGRLVTVKLAGVMPPVPATIVIDAAGKLVGWSAGYGDRYSEILGNLLLRAGVKLAPVDMPAKVWTVAETKEKPPEPGVARLKIGAPAPDFTSQTLDGRDVKLSDLRGQVVILDFWATWCGPCMASMPHTQEVSAKYKDQGVVVLANCTSDTRAKFEQWVKANQEKYPDIRWTHDAAERKPERASHALFGVSGIPTQFIIDRTGKVVDIVVGYMPGEAILDAALAKAGINVDPALVAKGAADLKRRGQ